MIFDGAGKWIIAFAFDAVMVGMYSWSRFDGGDGGELKRRVRAPRPRPSSEAPRPQVARRT